MKAIKFIKFIKKTLTVFFAIIFILFTFILSITIAGITFKIKPYIVLSGSMETSIHTGSLCLIKTDYDFEKVKSGDVIAFQKGKTMITHRVIEIDNEQQILYTKGDANISSDNGFVDSDNFRGLNVFSIPYLGYAVDFLQKPIVIIISSFVFFVLIIISDFTNVKKEKGEFYV